MKEKFKLIIWGCVTGFVNGMFGSGGGMIAVPVMEKYFNTPVHKAHATAIAVVLPLSVVSITRYASFANVRPKILFLACAGGVIGSFAGAKFFKRFAGAKLKKLFALVIIFAAVRMVIA